MSTLSNNRPKKNDLTKNVPVLPDPQAIASNRNHQKLKTIELLKIFSYYTDANHGLSCNELIDKLKERGFAAERKSIYRDIHALQDARIPIAQIPGSPIKYALIERTFTFNEIQLMIDVISSCRWLTNESCNVLIEKVKRFCSIYDQARISNHVCVVDRPGQQEESPFDKVDIINSALNQNRKVQFSYIKYDIHGKEISVSPLDKVWTVTPVDLLYGNDNYYLIGYLPLDEALSISSFFVNDTYGGLFLIRLDSMRDISVSPQSAYSCSLIENFDFSTMPRIAMYAAYLRDVTLSFRKDDIDASCTLINHFGKDLTVRESTDSNLAQVCVKAAPSPEMFGWLMQMADKIWLDGPQDVIDQYLDWIETHVNPRYNPDELTSSQPQISSPLPQQETLNEA